MSKNKKIKSHPLLKQTNKDNDELSKQQPTFISNL